MLANGGTVNMWSGRRGPARVCFIVVGPVIGKHERSQTVPISCKKTATSKTSHVDT